MSDHPTILSHRDGVPWWEAPRPRWWHRCKPQTIGYHNGIVERCACGAIRFSGFGPWVNRNSR